LKKHFEKVSLYFSILICNFTFLFLIFYFPKMSLKEIFCQDKAISILQRSLAADKMAHASIFAGTDGVGKFRTACEWAKLLLCENPERQTDSDFSDSCGACQSCRLFEAGSHPDFNHVYKELLPFTRAGKGKPPPVQLPIDVVREFLIEKVPQRPTLSARKIFVVTETEKLNASSQNSLLKVLEEPPGYCSIILICTRLDKLLPTTRSRCQVVCFGPIDQKIIMAKLKETGLEQTKAQYFAGLAQGSLGQAHQWAQLESEGVELYKTKKYLVNTISVYEYIDALKVADDFLKQSKKISEAWVKLDRATSKSDINRKALKAVVQIIISALHDAMQLNVSPGKEIVNFDQAEQIGKLALRFDAEGAAEKIADMYETMRWIDSSVNEKLIFEQLLLNLADSGRMRFNDDMA
jgi:DNA polymerase III subunit delta'